MGKDVKIGIGVALVIGLLLFILLLARSGEEPVGPTAAEGPEAPATTLAAGEEMEWTSLRDLELVEPEASSPQERTAELEITGPPALGPVPVGPTPDREPPVPVYEEVGWAEPAGPPATVVAESEVEAPPASTPITILKEAPPQPQTYTVVKGDNLWSLAERFYGEGRRWKAIHQANRDVLPSASMLKEGMVLLIPQAVPTTQPALPQRMSVERPAAAAPVATTTTHTVERGDTLYGIARKFYGDGNLHTTIREANRDRVPDPRKIPVGTVLVIPPAPQSGE